MTREVRTSRVCRDGTVSSYTAEYIKEHTLTVKINGTAVYSIVCTACDLEEMVIGRLYTDGRISRDSIPTVVISKDSCTASVDIPDHEDIQKREHIIDMLPAKDIDDDTIFRLADMFAQDSPIHSRTRSAHRCILYLSQDIYHSFEDISRHNTIDKAIGCALIHGYDMADAIVYTSGRVPVDMVEKIIYAGIPVVISRAVPTYDSLLLAKKHGLTIIARAHPDGYCRYTDVS